MGDGPRYNGRSLDPDELRERIGGTRGRLAVDVEESAGRLDVGTREGAATAGARVVRVARGRSVLLVAAVITVVAVITVRAGARRGGRRR